MPGSQRFMSLVGVTASVILLVGCSAGGGEPAEEPSPPAVETSGDDGFPTDCLIDRVWSVDVKDLADQLLVLMQSQGSPATDVTGVGEMTMLFAEDAYVNAGTDVTFTLLVPVTDDAIMTGTQRQVGIGEGEWYWDATKPGAIVFESWEADYDITMKMTLNGETVAVPIDLPASGPDGTAMTVECEGDSLVTKPDGGLFTLRWTAVS